MWALIVEMELTEDHVLFYESDEVAEGACQRVRRRAAFSRFPVRLVEVPGLEGVSQDTLNAMPPGERAELVRRKGVRKC